MIEKIKLLKEPIGKFEYISYDIQKRLANGIKFSDGLNIIVGKNGSGKSTLLNIIKNANLITKTFAPTITSKIPTDDFVDILDTFDAFEIKQDYSYPIYNLYRLVEDKSFHINNSFDYSNYKKMITSSKGENVMNDIKELFSFMFETVSLPMVSVINEYKEEYPRYIETIYEYVEKYNIQSNNRTVLMDEPDQGLDIDNLEEIYNLIKCEKPQTQMIIVVHNPILIYSLSRIKGVNFIEMSDGYLERINKFVMGK